MLAFIAFAVQRAFASTIPTPSYAGDPNIEIPASSALHWYDLKKPHTEYLIYKGPNTRSQGEPVAENLFGPLVAAGPAGYYPSNIRAAYDITLKGSQAIAVIDYGHLVTALSDFNAFSSQFGLPQETSTNPLSSSNKVFQVVYEHPGVVPPVDPGWGVEEALDMEWVHAMAPNAKVYVIESDDGALDACNQIAAAISGVKEVSNSWIEYQEPLGQAELGYDHYYVANGVTFYSGAGDIGGWQGYPSTSPNIVSCGGTSLNMNTAGTVVTSETAWNGSGGGPSLYEPRPSFQNSVASIVGSVRGTPDLAAVADPYTGVAVYEGGAWYVVGGTSVATPVIAGIVNTTNTFFASSNLEHNLIYSLLGTKQFRDIVQGTAGSFSAGPGWDFITGCGAPLNLSHPVITYTDAPDQATTLTGTYISGNAASLGPGGAGYVVKGVPFPGVGSTADVRAHFTFTGAVPSEAASATFTITAQANEANIINEIFLYNCVTKNYDLYATPLLTTSPQTFTVTLSSTQAANYVDTNGNVAVLSRALLPHSVNTNSSTGYLYTVDSMSATYSFFVNQ